jgi:hypothetical protein
MEYALLVLASFLCYQESGIAGREGAARLSSSPSGSGSLLRKAAFLKSLIEVNALVSLGGGRAISTRSGEVAGNSSSTRKGARRTSGRSYPRVRIGR